jgi:hypothetical protein
MLRRTPKRANAPDLFAKVPLWWAVQAAEATKTPKALVWVWLLHLSWETRSKTFRLPNARLLDRGVSPYAKRRALRELEAACLIRVVREVGKSPLVTLMHL